MESRPCVPDSHLNPHVQWQMTYARLTSPLFLPGLVLFTAWTTATTLQCSGGTCRKPIMQP